MFDVDEMVFFFTSSLRVIFDRLAPSLKRASGPSALWLNTVIRKLIALKRRALYKFRQTRSPDDWQAYKQLRNNTPSAISRKKKAFLSSSISLHFPRHNLLHLDVTTSPSPTLPNHLLDPTLLNDFSLIPFQSPPTPICSTNF